MLFDRGIGESFLLRDQCVPLRLWSSRTGFQSNKEGGEPIHCFERKARSRYTNQERERGRELYNKFSVLNIFSDQFCQGSPIFHFRFSRAMDKATTTGSFEGPIRDRRFGLGVFSRMLTNILIYYRALKLLNCVEHVYSWPGNSKTQHSLWKCLSSLARVIPSTL